MAAFTRPRNLVLSALAVGVLSALYVYVTTMLEATGFGKTYINVNTTSCRQVGYGVLHGCEDIVVDPHTGLAYLACGSLAARQRWLNPGDAYDVSHEKEVDRVYVMGEGDTYSEIRLLEAAADSTLVPFSQSLRLHGFDIYWDPANPRLMTFMFINHQLDRAAVSIFTHVRGADHMVHVETTTSGMLHSPNNILAMSPRSFYATNDIKYDHGTMRALSANLRLADGQVVYRNDSGSFSIAASGIRYPNGIARYQDWIYVASCTDPGVRIYRANSDHTLRLQGRTYIRDGIPDNLFVDPQSGQVYATAFLKVGQTHRLFRNPSLETSRTAGTRILRLTQRSDASQGFDAESLLVDSGELMPTATIAAVQRHNQSQRLLVGCVMCHALVVCDL
ncbi:hypothetical protein LPJ70_001727 [Coemansia sp. RSA 2708]|nr:hypothetical protein LPJ70_001727 [Coemansia sp. RSA 2708]